MTKRTRTTPATKRTTLSRDQLTRVGGGDGFDLSGGSGLVIYGGSGLVLTGFGYNPAFDLSNNYPVITIPG